MPIAACDEVRCLLGRPSTSQDRTRVVEVAEVQPIDRRPGVDQVRECLGRLVVASFDGEDQRPQALVARRGRHRTVSQRRHAALERSRCTTSVFVQQGGDSVDGKEKRCLHHVIVGGEAASDCCRVRSLAIAVTRYDIRRAEEVEGGNRGLYLPEVHRTFAPQLAHERSNARRRRQ